jgi:hypothetical protein
MASSGLVAFPDRVSSAVTARRFEHIHGIATLRWMSG